MSKFQCLRALFLWLVLAIAYTLPASAFQIEICNSGKDEFYLAHAERHSRQAGWNVGGWTSLGSGECWTRNERAINMASVLVSYVDRRGKIGIVPYNRDFRKYGVFDYTKGPYKYCMNPKDRFFRKNVTSERGCPEGMVRVPFPHYLVQKSPDGIAKLAIAVDRTVLHAPEWVIPDPPKKKSDPNDEKYADAGKIDLVRGPDEYQIAAAEYRNFKLRMSVANLLFSSNGTIDIRKVTLDRCLSTKEDLYYCRYKLDISVDSPELGVLEGLLNAGLVLKGYYWSSFWVNKGRWQIDRQWQDCTEGATQIECVGQSID